MQEMVYDTLIFDENIKLLKEQFKPYYRASDSSYLFNLGNKKLYVDDKRYKVFNILLMSEKKFINDYKSSFIENMGDGWKEYKN